jgi:alkylation response protein AidB-like acyl-CoA dehydrogenase
VVDFTLTDEQKDLRELAHSFAEKEMRRVAAEYDKDGTWPQDIIDMAWEVGLMNTHIPEAYGGPGLDYLSGCLIEEEMGWGCSGIGTTLMANGLASAPITLGGSEETKKKYLGMLTEDKKLASFCLTEPDAGSDVSGMKTKAVKKGDKYVISGSKCFITNGTYADYFTVFAKTDPEAGHRGISAFVVDADLPGVSVDKKEDKMGQRASNTATISFDEVEIPVENLIGEENKGWTYAKFLLGNERTSMAGIGRSTRYLGRLKQIVKTEVGEDDPAFGEFIREIARVELDVLALEATELRIIAQMSRGIDPGPAASLFKIRGTEIFQRITDLTHQAIGNYGLAIREHPVTANRFMPGPDYGHTATEKYLNSRKLSIYGGSNEIQRNIIAKAVLGL